MSILAAPRRKQKISVDPQNVTWKNSETIGKTLMHKMGWSAGQGLGRDEQGAAENVKLKPNFSNRGLLFHQSLYPLF
jgi:Pin2-interacting protein X1